MGDRKIAGVITLTVDGVKQACAGNFKYNLGTPNRTTLVGQDGVHGFSEEPRAPWIEGDLRNTKGFDVKAFYEKKDFDTAESPILRDFSALYRSLWCLVGV